MDVFTAITRIKRQFGDEFDVVITTDDIYGWINDAELDIIRSTGCNDTKINPTSTTYPLSLPQSVNIKRISINNKVLQYTTIEELDLLATSLADTGYPQYWYKAVDIDGPKIYLWPVSDKSTSTEVMYSKTPTNMAGLPSANEFTVPEVYHDDIIKYCIARAHNKNNNLQAEQAQMATYDRNLNLRRDESQTGDTALYKAGDPMDFEAYT